MATTYTDAYKAFLEAYNTPGDPGSGAYNPSKALGRAIGALLDGDVNALTAALATYLPQFETLALLAAEASVSAKQTAVVWNDPTAANNGIYSGDGSGGWTRSRDLPGYPPRQDKEVCDFATTANVDLSGGGLANGTTHDGVTVTTGMRGLVKNQSTGAQNGIYIVPASGAASRATDADSASEIEGAAVYVQNGSANAGKTFYCTATSVVLGTTALPFVVVNNEATVQAILNSHMDRFVSESAGVDANVRRASIVDSDGRSFLSFGPDGSTVDSQQFIAELVTKAALDNTDGAIRRFTRHGLTLNYYDWNVILIMGQSNASGSNSNPLTTTQPYANKRYSGGSLIDLIEATDESCASGLANQMSMMLNDIRRPWDAAFQHDIIIYNAGAAGTVLAGLEQGTTPYNNAKTAVTNIKALADTAGKTVCVRSVIFLHGESDGFAGTALATYRDGIIAMKNDVNTDFKPLTGQSDDIPWLIVQLGRGDTGYGTADICRAMQQAADGEDDMFIVSPGYPYKFGTDGLHYDSHDQRLIGTQAAKWLHRYLFDGVVPSTLFPISAAIVHARAVDVRFRVPVPPIRFDIDSVFPADAGLGFHAFDSGGSDIPVAGVQIMSSDTVRVFTSSDIAVGDDVAYALETFTRGVTGGIGAGAYRGGRGCLCDSDVVRTLYTNQWAEPYNTANFCAAFRITIA